jgi:aminomethyltransferase
MLQKLCDVDLKTIGHHKISTVKLSNVAALASRTGYTGEDGFEVFIHPSAAAKLWNDLVALGALPCGLGARDTLRLESGMPLYGHEYNEGVTPLETPFMFAVKFEKGTFIGSEKLAEQKRTGIFQKLTGIKMVEQGIPRQGYKVFKGDKLIGYVTSGTMSPTLGSAIGMGFIRQELSSPGEKLSIEIRGNLIGAETVKLPFYKRTSV